MPSPILDPTLYRFLRPLAVAAIVVLASCGTPRFNMEPSEHRDWVELSRTSGTTVVSMDTLYRKGLPYALVLTANWTFGDTYFHIGSLSGNESVDIRVSKVGETETTRYLFHGGVVDMVACAANSRYSAMDVVDPVVDNDLFTPTGLSQSAVRAFCAKHRCVDAPPVSAQPPSAPRNTGTVSLVERDRTKGVTMGNGVLRQGGVIIGIYTESTAPVPGRPGDRIMTWQVSYPDKSPCATVTFTTSGKTGIQTIITASDGREQSVRKTANEFGTREFVEYLIDNRYL
jgi:hypothetical protein